MRFSITKEECGSTMDGVGNTCFYNSFITGARRVMNLKCLDGEPQLLKKLMEMGNWDTSCRGKMVDTETNQNQIQQLAQVFNLCICIYTEVAKNIIDLDHVQVFGAKNATQRVRIVKVAGALHYNLIVTICDDETMTMYENAYFNNKHFFDDEMNASTAAEASALNQRIAAQEKALQDLQAEIASWSDALTGIGSDAGVEMHLKKLFVQFRDTHDALTKLLGTFAR